MEWVEHNSRDLGAEGWLIYPKYGTSALIFNTGFSGERLN